MLPSAPVESAYAFGIADLLQKPHSRPGDKETPQVRIGQITVLVEEQSASGSRGSKTAAPARRSSPFGIRGL